MDEAEEDPFVASFSWDWAPRSPCAVPGTLTAGSLTDAVSSGNGGASVVEDPAAASWAPRSSSTAPGKLCANSSTVAVCTEGGARAEAEGPFVSSFGVWECA